MKIRLISLLLILLCSCSYDDHAREHPVYFDLVTYFNQEAVRLTKKHQKIDKTVNLDGKPERKTVVIYNWERELSAFTDADINKTAWKGLFQTLTTDSSIVYTSNSDKIAVKSVEIGQHNGKVLFVKIHIKNDNNLYHSDDDLTYFPDSLYEIKKSQKVKLMEKRSFEVRGNFN